MNKRQLIAAVADQAHVSKACVRRVLEATHTVAVEALQCDEKISISHIGVLEKVARAPRTGRNINTGKRVPIPSREMVRFMPAKKLNEEVRDAESFARRTSRTDIPYPFR